MKQILTFLAFILTVTLLSNFVYATRVWVGYPQTFVQIAQINEVLCKILCHNLCVLIQEMHELDLIKVNGDVLE
jgi:hypothetical protein